MSTETEEISIELARQAGFVFARDIPRYNTECLADGMDEAEARDLAFTEWHEAQDNARQYSPFEFTAKALNDAANSEEAWEAFDAGINDAFESGWRAMQRRFTFR